MTLMETKGSDGVKLWDIKMCVQLAGPKQGHVVRGPISCILWVTHRGDTHETLCYSTGLGYLVFWRQNARDVSVELAWFSALT